MRREINLYLNGMSSLNICQAHSTIPLWAKWHVMSELKEDKYDWSIGLPTVEVFHEKRKAMHSLATAKFFTLESQNMRVS